MTLYPSSGLGRGTGLALQRLGELRRIAPATLVEYQQSIEKRRACERLLQITIESVKIILQVLRERS